MARLEHRSISKRAVDGLSVGDKDAVFWDRELSGFGVRVYPSGAKVYVVQTRTLGKSKRVTLGRHGVISADQARRKAAMIIARIKAGEDPSPTPSVSVAELTVADLAERYLKEHAEVHCKPRTKEAYRWLVVKFALTMGLAAIKITDGRIVEAKIGVGAVEDRPVRIDAAEQALVGEAPSPQLFEAAADIAANAVDPTSDLHASAAYRRDLTRAMTQRALQQALGDTPNQGPGR